MLGHPRIRSWASLCSLLVMASMLSGCFLQRSSPPPRYRQFPLQEGQTYGPVPPAPILIRLGQSTIHASGSVGPSDLPQGSPAIWEGHAFGLEPDADRNRTVFFFVEADDLRRISLQFNDQTPVVEENPGAYVSGELSIVRWAQDYTLKVTAENHLGDVVSSAIKVTGEDARLEGEQTHAPLRMRLMRLGRTDTRDVQGPGFTGKIHRHPWPTCSTDCDPTTQGGALIAMVSGPTDTLALILDEQRPFFSTGLSYWPSPNYLIVAIPVREENTIEVAALSEAGDIVLARWDRPGV
jgi:hypothetical protein